jgi:hypothetical protein
VMKVRNGWIVAGFVFPAYVPANFGWLFRKVLSRPFPAGVGARA